MTRADVPTTDDVRDIWVDYHLNSLPRVEGIALVPEYQEAFDAWLETIRAEEQARFREVMELAEAEVSGLRAAQADLRAKVETLHAEALKWQKIREGQGYRETAPLFAVEAEAYADVLALVDGSSG